MRFAIALASVLLAASARKPANTVATFLNDPFGNANAFVSPDGKHALWGDYENSELEMEATAAHAKRPKAGNVAPTAATAHCRAAKIPPKQSARGW